MGLGAGIFTTKTLRGARRPQRLISSVHVKPPNMKKSSTKKRTKNEDYELRDEYDLSKMTIVAKGRFAPHRRIGKNVIVLGQNFRKRFLNEAE